MIASLTAELLKPVIKGLEFEIIGVKHDPEDQKQMPYKYVPQAKIGSTVVYIDGKSITDKKDDAAFAYSEEGAQELIDSLKASV